MDTEARIADLQQPANRVRPEKACQDTCGQPMGFTTRRLESFDFAEALQLMRKGAAVRRHGWNGPHHVQIQHPDPCSKMTLPYIYMTTGYESDRVPWIASQTDLLSADWCIVAPK